MADFEQVQKLREYANISYEEAKKALEEANGDMLEAVINLEKKGRIKAPETGGYYNSQHERRANGDSCGRNSWEKKAAHTNGSSFGNQVAAFFRWCGRLIHKGNINSFEVTKDDKRILTLPVTALVLLLLFAFWLVVLLLVLGLFFGYQYRFRGPDLEKPEVNRAMESVSRATTKAVDSMVNAVDQIAKDVKKDKGESDGAHPDH